MNVIKNVNMYRTFSLPAIAVFAVAFLMTPASVFAGPDCTTHPDHRSCGDGGGGGGGGGGGAAPTYKVALVDGAFIFSNKTVKLNGKGNELYDGGSLDMSRSGSDTQPEKDAWDDVFDVCANLLGQELIENITVQGNWTINKSSENDIRIRLRDIYIDNADVEIQLIGTPGSDFLPTIKGYPVYFNLDKFVIYGRSIQGGPGGSQGCQAAGGGGADTFWLVPNSVLMISLP